MSPVAILVPWFRRRLTGDEQISLRHLLHFLGNQEIIVVKPESLDGTLDGRPTESFADSYFESVDTYSRLLLTKEFYRRFEAWELILIHQLDALVLSDNLTPWLDMPWDYVGAPWLVAKTDPARGFSRVGNGGFGLRRVAACRRVLEEGRTPGLFPGLLTAELPDQQHLSFISGLAKKAQVLRQASKGVDSYTRHYTLNEDHFWCDRAHLFGTGFSTAPVDQGLAFAFEAAPRRAFEANAHKLPLGAHAWTKHDRAFWEPYLLSAPVTADTRP